MKMEVNDHPVRLLPTPLPITFTATVAMSRREFFSKINDLMLEYFETTKTARCLWQQHQEGLIDDATWTTRTLEAMKEYVQGKLQELSS